MKKTIKKSYRFDPDTNRLLQQNISRADKKKSESAYIRELIHRDYMTSVGIRAADLADAKRQLVGIGTNINQIARKLHTDGEIPNDSMLYFLNKNILKYRKESEKIWLLIRRLISGQIHMEQ